MKRVIAVFLILCLALALAACGGEKCIVCGKKATKEYSYSGGVKGTAVVNEVGMPLLPRKLLTHGNIVYGLPDRVLC